MDAGINNLIYMELHSGPKMANGACVKTIVAGTTDRGSTVFLHSFTTQCYIVAEFKYQMYNLLKKYLTNNGRN